MMSDQDAEFYKTSQQHWQEIHANYAPYFVLEAVDRLGEIYYKHLKELYASQEISLPANFVEIGSGKNPFIKNGVAALFHAAGNAKRKASVFLADYAYEQPQLRYNALNAVRFQVEKKTEYLPGALANDDAEIPKEGKAVQYWIDRNRELEIQFSQQGIPDLVIPQRFGEYNLAFMSVANYVNMRDLRLYLNDPRIRSVAFVNGSALGKTQVPQEPSDRLNSSLDVVREFVQREFVRVSSIFSYYKGEDVKQTEFSQAPVIGTFLIKPKNEKERVWIQAHQTTDVMEIL